ncbi:hypothetical protein TSUD_406450 [Trifolium subterraneum]|uniref:Endonuclease/exonuclease/phosphatase domain-containing protein n=1 Tax=Trifolium subterraneum TaxID=3900 RepID=A0A2Z6PFY2_TRISU|nr:hypothetical protein TSUD_406450 [Trifolium subterraneum]
MRHSKLRKLWNGVQKLDKLITLDLCNFRDLIEISDLSRAPNLQKVDLSGCVSLRQLHPSVFTRPKLRELSLIGCKFLENRQRKDPIETTTVEVCYGIRQTVCDLEGIGLEVVLSQPVEDCEVGNCSLVPCSLASRGVVGNSIGYMLAGEQLPLAPGVSIPGTLVDKERGDAHHIIDIQEDLGMNFHGEGDEDVVRSMGGLGSRVKRRKIRDMVRDEQLDFLAIQETKLEVISDALVLALWGNNDCCWSYLPSVGNSGGILSIWNKVKASLVFTFIGDGFVGVCLDLLTENKRCFVINVYAKCSSRDKRTLWSNILMSKRGFGDGLWCIVGDFNSIRDSSERRGVNLSHRDDPSAEMRSFNEFVGDLDLFDMPLVGRMFTWFHPNGIAMSRLDRLLVSPLWLDSWGDSFVRVLDRDVSDHCPLVLRYCSVDWGPKPFRFNNFCLQSREFKDVIKVTWASQEFIGWMGFILKERLKGLKGVIKEWTVRNFGDAEGKKKRLTIEIAELDSKSEGLGLVDAEVVLRKKLFEELWILLRNMDALIFQRSRSRWIKEGDSNSRYFHNCVKARKRRNNLLALRTPSGWVEGPTLVREAVVSYFKNHFDNGRWHRPTLDGIVFPQLSANKVEDLTAIFTLEEIIIYIKVVKSPSNPNLILLKP